MSEKPPTLHRPRTTVPGGRWWTRIRPDRGSAGRVAGVRDRPRPETIGRIVGAGGRWIRERVERITGAEVRPDQERVGPVAGDRPGPDRADRVAGDRPGRGRVALWPAGQERAGPRSGPGPGRAGQAGPAVSAGRAGQVGPAVSAGRAGQIGPAVSAVLTGAAVVVLAVLAVVTASVVADRRQTATPTATSGPPPAMSGVATALRPDGPLAPIGAGGYGPDWQDWSWAATVTPRRTAPDGTPALRVVFQDGFAGLSLRQSTPTRPAPAAVLRARVWVEGAGSWLGLTVQQDDQAPGLHGPDTRVPGGRWATLSVPVRSLGPVEAVRRITVEHRSAELRGAHRPVTVWVAELTLS